MNNQPRNLANKLANANIENNNDDENEVSNSEDIDNEPTQDNLTEEPNEKEEQIKSVELTGKDAVSLNQTNSAKKGNLANIPAGNGNSNNLTKKKNNNLLSNRNITQKQNPNINVSTETSATSDDKNVMRSLNKVAMNLLNHQIVMKLFHFQTELYGAHKASDSYLEKFAATMDKFLEIAQGIYGRLTIKKFKLEGSSHSDDNIMKHIEGIISLLRTGIDDVLDNYTDLINVRDELVGDAEQLKYLLSFK